MVSSFYVKCGWELLLWQEFSLASACGSRCLAHKSENVSARVNIRDDLWCKYNDGLIVNDAGRD